MSSDSVTTTSSRLREFGLYKTIDARTEEFLRLSKKRQIRQGCACAAVSTAITITVVVCVILVYEYSTSLEPRNKLSVLKPSWLGLINDSSDTSAFETKFNKAKFNFDRATLKLLPVLIKALNQNRYLEKIIEDYASSSPSYDKKDTTAFSYKRHVFSGTRNRARVPPSKLYTIDYKTSPIVFLKRNIDYNTKIRKIKDYQGIYKYLGKIINDNVGPSVTHPVSKEYQETEKPATKTARLNRKSIASPENFVSKINKNVLQTSSIENKTNCKCTKKLSELLSKLISSIHRLIPDLLKIKLSTLTSCEEQLKAIKSQYKMQSPNSKLSTSSPDENRFPLSLNPLTDINEISTKLEIAKSEQSELLSDSISLSTEKESLSKIITNDVNSNNTVIITKTSFTSTTPTLMDGYIEPTLPENIRLITTKPMSKFVSITTTTNEHNNRPRDFDSTTSNIEETTTPFQTYSSTHITDEFYNDYIDSTTESGPVNSPHILDMNSLEDLKNKIIITRKESKNENEAKTYVLLKVPNFFRISNHSHSKKLKHRNKFTYVLKNPNSNDIGVIYLQRTLIPSTATGKLLSKINNKTSKILARRNRTDINERSNKPDSNVINKLGGIHTFDDVISPIEDEMFKIMNEENLERDSQVQKHDNVLPFRSKLTTKASNSWELWSSDKHRRQSKSMLPQSRPTYLDIHRNGWRHDYHNDYDTGVNNNNFE